MPAKIIPSLWYTKEAEEAARFYAALFPDSHVDRVTPLPSDSPSGPAGSVALVDFTLFGLPFQAISAGPLDPFNHAVSFTVLCEDQREIDRYWDAILAHGGTVEECGWIRDRYGLCWQIVPRMLHDLLTDRDLVKAKRVGDAMLSMKKLDVAGLRAAYEGEAKPR